jgi:AcrR family transcriptional regulator
LVRNEEAEIDGRVLRGERNRSAIVDALLALLESGDLKPSANAIAARAGVSVRSVFQHFDDLETLYAALVERQTERVRALNVDIDSRAAFASRLAMFVDHRARLYERIAPVRRATLLAAHDSPTLQRALKAAATRHAREVGEVFGPELEQARNATDLRAALTVATSWEAWERLRTSQRCSVDSARRVVVALAGAAVRAGV